jgi:hypothetical protein
MYHYGFQNFTRSNFQTISRDVQIIKSKTFLSNFFYFLKLFKNSHHYLSIDAKSNIAYKVVDNIYKIKIN